MNTSRYKTLASTIAISVLTMLAAVSCGGQARKARPLRLRRRRHINWCGRMISMEPMARRPMPRSGRSRPAAAGGATTNWSRTRRVRRTCKVSGGNLVITAMKEDYTGSDGIPRHYTSARMQTKGLFSQTVWAVRGADQDSQGTGHVAGVLDAGQQYRHRGLAGVWRDRHHGEHREGAGDGAWNAARDRAIHLRDTRRPTHCRAGRTSRRLSHLRGGVGGRSRFASMWTATLYATDTQAGSPSADHVAVRQPAALSCC